MVKKQNKNILPWIIGLVFVFVFFASGLIFLAILTIIIFGLILIFRNYKLNRDCHACFKKEVTITSLGKTDNGIEFCVCLDCWNILDEYSQKEGRRDWDEYEIISILKRDKSSKKQSNYSRGIKSDTNTFSQIKDDSIIDVSGKSYQIAADTFNINYNDYWELGSKYKDKLKLEDNEVKLLNSLIDTNNKFNSIEFCAVELIRLLLNCIKKLEEFSKQNNSNFENVINEIAHIEITSEFKYKKGSYDYKIIYDNFNSTVYQCIYKTCENTLRDYFNVGRKTNLNWYLHSENAAILFKEKILNIIVPFIELSISEKKEIDLESEIKINNYSRSRYKIMLDEISNDFKNVEIYQSKIFELANRNQDNPHIEHIFFEASKFISKQNKEIALVFYIHYLYHDLNSVTFNNKQLTKTIQKSLFSTNEQLHNFEIIVSELLMDRDLEKALKSLSKVYEVKRKKIKLDRTIIKNVQAKHKATVVLLNDYLQDTDDTILEVSENLDVIESEEKKIILLDSIYLDSILFNEKQILFIKLFGDNNLVVKKSEVDKFVKNHGLFKNQLIDSINSLCNETIDDVLIEEEDLEYTIYQEYYKKIVK